MQIKHLFLPLLCHFVWGDVFSFVLVSGLALLSNLSMGREGKKNVSRKEKGKNNNNNNNLVLDVDISFFNIWISPPQLVRKNLFLHNEGEEREREKWGGLAI